MSIRYQILLMLISATFFISSCKKEQVYNGELGFAVVGMGPLEDYTDTNGVVVIEKFDTLTNPEFLEDWELELKVHYDYLKENGILNYESILFGVSPEEYDVVFLPHIEFQKISQYKRHPLVVAKRKVLLRILGTRIDSSSIKGIEILDIKEVPGSTFYKK